MEHFVTLFDSKFIPQGIALYDSLASHQQPFVLWVICVDNATSDALRVLALPHLKTIPVREIEARHPELLSIKGSRTPVELCWTLTPFAPEAVFCRDPTVQRVTYVDADVYFFGAPSLLLSDMDSRDAHVMVTDHARAPEYQEKSRSGRFCVQFMPFLNTERGLNIIQWWQSRCINWCHARFEDSRFGDQKYLEEWPTRFGLDIHILTKPVLTLAPWNIDYLAPSARPPGLYHFQGFRLFLGGEVRLWRHFGISDATSHAVYEPYLDKIREVLRRLLECGISVPLTSAPPVGERGDPEQANRFGKMQRWTRL